MSQTCKERTCMSSGMGIWPMDLITRTVLLDVAFPVLSSTTTSEDPRVQARGLGELGV